MQQRQRAGDQRQIEQQGDVGHGAEDAVGDDHEDQHQDEADDAGDLAGADRIGAEIGTDGAFLEDGERRRQGAGAKQQRQILRLDGGETAGDDAGAAHDRFADDRGADDLAVENDGEGPADVLLGDLAELSGAGDVEAETDHRPALFDGRLGVDEVIAGDHDPFLHHIFDGAAGRRVDLVVGGQDFGARRRPASARPYLGRRHRGVDETEIHLGGLAQQPLDPFRIVDARQLHDDAVAALALDRRLGGAEFVDAPAHDLDRLGDDLVAALGYRLFRIAHTDLAAAIALDHGAGFGLPGHARRAVHIGEIAHPEGGRLALDAELAITDLSSSQNAAKGVDQIVEALARHRLEVDLEQQVRSPLQIEAEAKLLVGKPGWNTRRLLGGEEIRRA